MPIDHIPVSFDYKGKHYEGSLDEVNGSGGRTWFLNINKYHRGQLLFVNDKFVFYGSDKMFEDLAEFFGEIIMLWYE